MKFGQLTEYNMRNIFHTQSVVEKPFSHPFLKNQNWAYLMIKSLNSLQPVLLFYTPWKQPKGFLMFSGGGGIERQHRAVMG